MMLPKISVAFEDAAEPLRNRAPAHDENGRPLSDFMILIPGLRDKPQHLIDTAVRNMALVLAEFSHVVVFAEFNIRLNLLWVSIRPLRGVRYEISSAIQQHIPEARLVSHI